jgi:hypothetical protein
MQIIELYIKGYKRINGSSKGFATNKLIDSQAEFNQTVEVNDIVTNLRTNEVAKITAIDSDTQLSLSDDIFVSPNYDIYRIESDYFRADLFEDESVVITDSLMNVKDIKKVFTPFSQQFNLPASKLNNKLFRHYENFNIENSFDARYRHDAIIKLNGIDYQKGKIQFKSVSLKDNKAHAYKVVFYGDAVELKEVLGDTKLSGLNYTSSLNFDYAEANIKDLFTNTDSNIISLFGSTDILVPNIHHSKNMRYTNAGYKDNITGTELSWVDLKPAIRCRAIIEAINNTFPQINLTGFFNSTSFSDVYMWLHKNEGFVSNAEEGGGTRISSNRFRNIDDSPNNFTFNAGLSSGVTQDVRTLFWQPPPYFNRFKIKAYVTTTTPENFTVRIINSFTNYTYATQDFSSSSGTVSVETDFIGSNQNYPFDITLEVEADSNITMTQRLEITKKLYPFVGIVWTAVYDVDTPNVQNDFIISKQMPDIKVMDFLSGLFKMFNLVVFKDGNDITVQKASFYMNIGNKYDITKYVDISTSNVERLFPYKEMEFKFKSKKSFLVQFSDEIQGIPFAQESYPESGTEFDGSVYKVELPFEKMMYERLSNEDTGAQTLIGQGAMLDKKFEPTIGEPLLFCMVRQANTNNELTIDGTTPTHYRRPTNLTSFNWGYSIRLQLNFGLEADEWEGEIPSQTTNLFEEGYLDYVESVFNKKGKMYKVDTYLPLSLITKYKLNDTFIINNTSFRINSIKTNLLTNKTQLELYNKDEYANQILNGQVAYLDRPTELQATSITSTQIVISFRGNGDETDFNIYLDGGFFGSIPSIGSPAVYGYSGLIGLESGRTYNITVRAKYNVSGTDLFSFDTGITETTL